MAESVGLALLVVLDRLTPAQRVAFVLHDVFAVPFEEIAAVVDRSPVAAKKLASRARDRVQGAGCADGGARPGGAARVDRLPSWRRPTTETWRRCWTCSHPTWCAGPTGSPAPAGIAAEVRGADAVAEETKAFAARARTAEVALVDGAPGIVVAPQGRLLAVLHVTVVDGRIAEFEVVG